MRSCADPLFPSSRPTTIVTDRPISTPTASRPPQTRASAAVALVCTRREPESVLLIRRSERHDDPWSGHWSLPGGRKDPADGDLLETALRELAEECGIRLDREQLTEAFPARVARRRTGPWVNVAPFRFEIEDALPTVLDPREAAGSLWLPRQRLLDPARHRLVRPPRVPEARRFPAIEIDGPPLWGFTYRVLLECWLGSDFVCERTASEVASEVLDYLTARGMPSAGWRAPSAEELAENPALAQCATVEGEIPAAEVLRHFSESGSHVQAISTFEACAEFVQITGLGFEDYWIAGRVMA